MTFSPDTWLLASASRGDTIKLWDFVTGITGTEKHTFHFTLDYLKIGSLNFSKHGPYLDTNIGSFDIQPWYRKCSSSRPKSQSNIGLLGGQWVTLNNQKDLWLPFEYRPKEFSILSW